MAKRYELSDESWEMIEDLITQDQKTGRPRNDDRLMLNGLVGALLRCRMARYALAFRPLVDGLSALS